MKLSSQTAMYLTIVSFVNTVFNTHLIWISSIISFARWSSKSSWGKSTGGDNKYLIRMVDECPKWSSRNEYRLWILSVSIWTTISIICSWSSYSKRWENKIDSSSWTKTVSWTMFGCIGFFGNRLLDNMVASQNLGSMSMILC